MKSFGQPFKILSLIALIGLIGSCSPQGEWVPVLHPPHSSYFSQATQARPAAARTAASSQTSGRAQAGLPPRCQSLTQSEATPPQLCIDCREEPWLLQRCFPYEGDFVPSEHCVHTPEHIKCLMAEPIFVLMLPLKKSQERALFENYEVWERAVRDIWQDRLGEVERQELDSLLRLSRRWAEWLTQANPLQVEKSELRVLSIQHAKGSELEALLRPSLERLQALRLSGKLNLSAFLQEIKALLDSLGSPPRLLEYLDALSLEGLEEPSRN